MIEDTADLCDLWASELEAAGFIVSSAADGETGAREAKRFAPALIVLDLALPRLDGFSVARWVRALGGGTEIAILAVSGLSSDVLHREAIAAGCDAFLMKPVTGQALVVEAVQILTWKASLIRLRP